jgi:hypothetical protein
MLVSDLCERSQELRDGELWTEFATDVVGKGLYGMPYTNWDMLDRITFAYFIAKGPSRISLETIVHEQAQRDNLDDLIDALEYVRPTDFVHLLQIQEVFDFILKERSHSTIWVLAPSVSSRMVCMRTGLGTSDTRL